MGFVLKSLSNGAAAGIGLSSKVASRVNSHAVDKAAMSVLARFLPAGLGDSLVEIVDIIQKIFPEEFTTVDINTALSVLAILQSRSTKPVHNIRKFSPIEDSPIARNFAHYMKYATSAYGRTPLIDPASMLASSDREWIKIHTGLPYDKIYPYVDTNAVRGRHLLEHYVAVDDAEKSVILALKGTLTLAGALKDVRCEYSKVNVWGTEYEVHGGMWKSAQDLITYPPLLSQIKQELEANPDYRLVVLGHSLGGGVAALVSILLAAESTDGQFFTNSLTVPGKQINCIGFEPAASIDEDLAIETKTITHSVVNKNDIVPSLSHGAVQDFKIIAKMLKEDTSYLGTIINGLIDCTLDADKHLDYFRSLGQNKKLVPPGRVWAIDANDMGKLEIGEVTNVNQRFGEARFIQGMITHHFPKDCVNSLAALEGLDSTTY